MQSNATRRQDKQVVIFIVKLLFFEIVFRPISIHHIITVCMSSLQGLLLLLFIL